MHAWQSFLIQGPRDPYKRNRIDRLTHLSALDQIGLQNNIKV